MLELVFAKQLPDGRWPWDFNGTNMDQNAVQFISLPLLLLVTHFRDVLPAQWLQKKMPQLELAGF